MPTWNPPAAPPPASNEHYSVAANWTGGLPIATTDAIFDGAVSNRNCIINTTGLTCLNFTIQNNYTGTITFTNTLTVRGNITFQTSVAFAGPNGILAQNTATSAAFNSNNKVFNLPFTIQQNGGSVTFSNTWTVTNFTTNNVSGNPITYTGGTVNVTGNLTNGQTSTVSTTQFVLTGTGTFSATANWGPPIEINTSGVITVASISLSAGCVFRYTTASNIISSGTVSIPNSGSATFDLNNIALNNFSSGFNSTVTLLSPANFNNATFGAAGGTSSVLNGAGQRFNVRGNLNIAQNPGGLLGTGIISLTGSGTISSAAAALSSNNSIIGVDFELNTSGTYTVTSNMSFTNSKTFTRTNGLINWSSFTLFINSTNCTFNTSGITFNNITIVAAVTLNITSSLNLSGTLQLNGSTTFAGTAGWTCATLINTTANSTITLQNSVTYRTTTGVQLVSTAAQPIIMISNNPSVRAIWTLDAGATQNIIYVNGTRIDSSGGQTIWTFGGIISNTPLGAETLNWRTGTRPGTIAYVFLN